MFISLGWTLRDYAKRVWDNSGEDNVLFLAGGIAFNLILAALPFILLLVAGVTLLLLAFLLSLMKRMRMDGYPYATLNCVGAALACYSSWLVSFMPFVVLEGVWALAAAFALGRKALSPA